MNDDVEDENNAQPWNIGARLDSWLQKDVIDLCCVDHANVIPAERLPRSLVEALASTLPHQLEEGRLELNDVVLAIASVWAALGQSKYPYQLSFGNTELFSWKQDWSLEDNTDQTTRPYAWPPKTDAMIIPVEIDMDKTATEPRQGLFALGVLEVVAPCTTPNLFRLNTFYNRRALREGDRSIQPSIKEMLDLDHYPELTTKSITDRVNAILKGNVWSGVKVDTYISGYSMVETWDWAVPRRPEHGEAFVGARLATGYLTILNA